MVKKLESDITGAITGVINDRFSKIKKQFSMNLGNVFQKTFDRAVSVGSDLGGDRAAKANIKQKILAVSKVMSKDIDTIKNEQSQNVARVVAQSYAQGLPSLKLKQQVSDTIGKSGYRIDSAIRTNTAYLSSLTKLMTWMEMGFTEYEWVLGKDDSGTRPKHKWYHGRTFKIKDALANKAPIPGHVPNPDGSINLSQSMNCRCGIRLPKRNKESLRLREYVEEEVDFYTGVVVINTAKDRVLLAKRVDDGLWTSPGGKPEKDESPEQAVIRELKEEANITVDIKHLNKLKVQKAGNGKPVYVYYILIDENKHDISPKNDPDEEVKKWTWFKFDELPSGVTNDIERYLSVISAIKQTLEVEDKTNYLEKLDKLYKNLK